MVLVLVLNCPEFIKQSRLWAKCGRDQAFTSQTDVHRRKVRVPKLKCADLDAFYQAFWQLKKWRWICGKLEKAIKEKSEKISQYELLRFGSQIETNYVPTRIASRQIQYSETKTGDGKDRDLKRKKYKLFFSSIWVIQKNWRIQLRK